MPWHHSWRLSNCKYLTSHKEMLEGTGFFSWHVSKNQWFRVRTRRVGLNRCWWGTIEFWTSIHFCEMLFSASGTILNSQSHYNAQSISTSLNCPLTLRLIAACLESACTRVGITGLKCWESHWFGLIVVFL